MRARRWRVRGRSGDSKVSSSVAFYAVVKRLVWLVRIRKYGQKGYCHCLRSRTTDKEFASEEVFNGAQEGTVGVEIVPCLGVQSDRRWEAQTPNPLDFDPATVPL